MTSLYMDNSTMMSDFMSDSSYSPRAHFSPTPTSPHYDSELSPHRLFASQSVSARHVLA